MTQPSLPRQTDTKFFVEQVGQETLVYVEASHKAFCLNRTSAAVWNLCDGAHTLVQIAAAATLQLAEPVSEELVIFALDQLQRDGLVQALSSAPLPLLSRREMVEKLGVRALIMLPVIAAIVVPEAAQALSGIVYGARENRLRARRSIFDQEAAAAPKQEPAGSDPFAP